MEAALHRGQPDAEDLGDFWRREPLDVSQQNHLPDGGDETSHGGLDGALDLLMVNCFFGSFCWFGMSRAPRSSSASRDSTRAGACRRRRRFFRQKLRATV